MRFKHIGITAAVMEEFKNEEVHRNLYDHKHKSGLHWGKYRYKT